MPDEIGPTNESVAGWGLPQGRRTWFGKNYFSSWRQILNAVLFLTCICQPNRNFARGSRQDAVKLPVLCKYTA